jgi:hypothetical protein
MGITDNFELLKKIIIYRFNKPEKKNKKTLDSLRQLLLQIVERNGSGAGSGRLKKLQF